MRKIWTDFRVPASLTWQCCNLFCLCWDYQTRSSRSLVPEAPSGLKSWDHMLSPRNESLCPFVSLITLHKLLRLFHKHLFSWGSWVMGHGVSGCLRHSPNPHGAFGLAERWAWKEKASNIAWQVQKVPAEQRDGLLLIQLPQEFWYKQKLSEVKGLLHFSSHYQVPFLIMLRDEWRKFSRWLWGSKGGEE